MWNLASLWVSYVKMKVDSNAKLIYLFLNKVYVSESRECHKAFYTHFLIKYM